MGVLFDGIGQRCQPFRTQKAVDPRSLKRFPVSSGRTRQTRDCAFRVVRHTGCTAIGAALSRRHQRAGQYSHSGAERPPFPRAPVPSIPGRPSILWIQTPSPACCWALTMMSWLTQDLAATTKEWIIAFRHYPPYSKGSHDSDTESPLIQTRENALPILEAAGVDLVLSGHGHSYERSCDNCILTPNGLVLPDAGVREYGDCGVSVQGREQPAREGRTPAVPGAGQGTGHRRGFSPRGRGH